MVGLVFRLIKQKLPAYIQGRDMVKGLETVVNKFKANSHVEFIQALEEYETKEVEKALASKYASDAKVIAITDKCDCLRAFADSVTSDVDFSASVIKAINEVFKEDGYGVRLSSIHKSKGLEADRVFLWNPAGLPHPMAKGESKAQEFNLRYVARTRAINHLTNVIVPR